MSFYINILISLAVGLITSYFAYKRGRDPGIWVLIGTFLGIFGLLILFLMKDLSKESAEEDADKKDAGIFGFSPEDEEEEEKALIAMAPVIYPSDQWFYADKNYQQQGPVGKADLLALLQKEEISKETLVWKEGMTEWKKLSEVESLSV